MKVETIGQKASPGESATEGNESVQVRAEVLAGKFTKTRGKVDGLNGTNMWSLMQEKFGLTGDQLVQLRQALIPAKVQGNPGTLVRIFSPASCKEKGVTVQDFDSLNEHPELILHEGYYWGRGGPGEIVVEEKPAQPKTLADAPDYALASIGIYIFKLGTLLEALQGQEEDFGKHVIPGMIGSHHDIYVYDYEKENKIEDFKVEVKDGIREKVLVDKTRDSSYWKDVGTIDSYYQASMDLVGVDPLFNLYGERWPLRTYQRPLPPSKCVLGGKTSESMVCDGCIISGGTVWNSILSPGLVVERGAEVEQSVIFDDVIIEPGARIRRAIVDKQSRIRAGTSIGYDQQADKRRGCTISDNGIVVVPKGMDIRRSELSLL